MDDVIAIIHLGRAWGVRKNGMLRSNSLITKYDWERLESWIEVISYTFMCLLEGSDNEAAFEEYEEYKKEAQQTHATTGGLTEPT